MLLDAPAELVQRWVPRDSLVESLGPQRCRLVLGSWSWAGLAATAAMFDVDLEVVGPPELREACATLSQRLRPRRRRLTGPTRARTHDAPGRAGRPGASGGARVGQASAGSSTSRFLVFAGSTGMPGPIVVEMVALATYRPLEDDGLSRSTSSRAAA